MPVLFLGKLLLLGSPGKTGKGASSSPLLSPRDRRTERGLVGGGPERPDRRFSREFLLPTRVAASGRIKEAGMLRSCEVLTSKLSFSFVLAPAPLLWNYPPASPAKPSPERDQPHPGELFLEKQDPSPSQSRELTTLGGSAQRQPERGWISATTP